MRYTKNLTSRETFVGNPWELVTQERFDKEVPVNKVERSKWQQNPQTDWVFYSGWEGLQEGARITGANDANPDANPPHRLLALVADLDAPVPEDMLKKEFERKGALPPSRICKSRSDHWHFVWELTEPVLISGHALAKAFLKIAFSRLPIRAWESSIDTGAFMRASQFYCAGADWSHTGYVLNSATVTGWVVEAIKDMRSAVTADTVLLPLPKIREMLMKDPEFANSEWAGLEFEENAQGPTWFVPGSVSPKSAIIKPDGVYTFSQNAAKSFYKWEDILGKDVVNTERDTKLGEAVKGCFFEEMTGSKAPYWIEITPGEWVSYTKDQFERILVQKKGLSSKGGEQSTVSRALGYLESHARVAGAGHFVYFPTGIIETSTNKKLLNISRRKVCQPASGEQVWGEEGRFPKLSQIMGAPSCLDPENKVRGIFYHGGTHLDLYLAWLKHAYSNALKGRPEQGHVMFLLGPTSCGKSLLATDMVGPLMGGFQNCNEMLTGATTFGGERYQFGLWVVDDAQSNLNNAEAHRNWSSLLKRIAANRVHAAHEKFKAYVDVDWYGRLLIVANEDMSSIRLVPELDGSLMDKLIGLRCQRNPALKSLPDDDVRRAYREEVPYFAAWLLQWEMPEHCKNIDENGRWNQRFGGIRPFFDSKLIKRADQTSDTSLIESLLSSWVKRLSVGGEYPEIKENGFIERSLGELYTLFAMTFPVAIPPSLRGNYFSLQLQRLLSKNSPVVSINTDDESLWRIHLS
jgi:hypothetical protein